MNELGGDFTGQDVNLYAYVRNNPLLYTDPEGRLIQFGVAATKIIRAAVIAFRFYTDTYKGPKAPKRSEPEPPVIEEPGVTPSLPKAPKAPKPPGC